VCTGTDCRYNPDEAKVEAEAIIQNLHSMKLEQLADFEAARDRFRNELDEQSKKEGAAADDPPPKFAISDANSTSGFRLQVE
jgi:hypothetical protein